MLFFQISEKQNDKLSSPSIKYTTNFNSTRMRPDTFTWSVFYSNEALWWTNEENREKWTHTHTHQCDVCVCV